MSLRNRSALAAALLPVALVLGACEGHNLFTGADPDRAPRVMALNSPVSGFAGDTIQISVDAEGPREISKITLQLRRAFSKDSIHTVTPPAAMVSQTFRIGTPTLLSDSVLVVTAIITDVIGANSSAATDSVILRPRP